MQCQLQSHPLQNISHQHSNPADRGSEDCSSSHDHLLAVVVFLQGQHIGVNRRRIGGVPDAATRTKRPGFVAVGILPV